MRHFWKSRSNADGNFGLNGHVQAICDLKARLKTEQATLEAEKTRLRDQAAVGAEMDESGVLKAQVRVAAVEAALSKAWDEAAAQLAKQTPEIHNRLAELEEREKAVLLERDRERLRRLAEFLRDEQANLHDLPRRNVGGVVGIPAMGVLEGGDVSTILGELKAALGERKATKVETELAGVAEELRILRILTRLGTPVGSIEVLVAEAERAGS